MSRSSPMGRRLAGSARRALAEAGLTPGDTLLAAVSGGVDSGVLLHLLAGLTRVEGLALHAAHLDHGLRPGSAADADFVAGTCAELGVPLVRVRRPVRPRPGESLQAAARRVRYRFLLAAARRLGARAVATAHHADDLAETVLMRLVAGAGSAGLAAMARPRPGVVRPLLAHTKADLVAYARERGLAFREDPSNADPKYLRNRLRGEVLPALEAVNPALVATLCREARVLADEADFVARAAADFLKSCRGADAAGPHLVSLPRAAFAALHPAVARRLAADLVARHVPGRRGAAAVEALLDLARGPAGRRVDLGRGLVAEARYGRLVVGPAPSASTWASDEPATLVLEVPGVTEVPWAGLCIEAAHAVPPGTRGWVHVDPSDFSGPLVVRPRRPGDRFRPAGMGGRSRSLKRYLIDRKVPRERRDRLALVAAPEGIVWVVGLRQDGRFVVKGYAGSDRGGVPPLALRVLPGRPWDVRGDHRDG